MNKIAVITGASDGLGKALAEKLVKNYKVIALARNETALEELAKATGCEYIVCDVRNAKQVQQVFDKIAADHSTIDILINNAGVIVNGELIDTSDDDIEDVITQIRWEVFLSPKLRLNS